MNQRGVVITGRGIICSAGKSMQECRKAFSHGISCLSPLTDQRLIADYGPHFAGLIHTTLDITIHSHLTSYIDRYVQLAMIAAQEACLDSGKNFLEHPGRSGIILGTCSGPMNTIESLYEREASEQLFQDAALMFSKQYYSASLILADQTGISGPAFTVTTACSAFSVAVGIATDLIRTGMLDVVLVGGSDAFSITTQAGFNGLRATCKAERCAPFSKPVGLNLGEGAGFLILEHSAAAQKRNAQVYGEILGYGLSNDAWHCSSPDPSGKGAAKAISNALQDASITTDQIQYINAHGTGTEANDKSETKAIKHIFGENASKIPISSLKAVTGHCLGAAGAIETIASLDCIGSGILPPTAQFIQKREGCTLDYIPDKNRKWNKNSIFIKNNFAFGGNNASIVISDRERKPAYPFEDQKTNDPICVTSIGLISAAGIGVNSLLKSEEMPLVKKYHPNGYHINVASIPEIKMSAIDRRIDTKGLDNESSAAIAAAVIALREAGISERIKLRRNIGLIMNIAHGSTWAEAEHIKPLLQNDFKLEQINAFPFVVPNSISGTICRTMSLTGFNSTFCNGPGAGLSGLALSWVTMMNNHSPVLLSGSIDMFSQGMLDFVCSEEIDPETELLGEGAAMFVLERRSHAENRGIQPLFSIESVAFSNTVHDKTSDIKNQNTMLHTTIKNVLESAEINSEDIDVVCCNRWDNQRKIVENLIGDVDFIDISSITGYAPCSQSLFNLAASIVRSSVERNRDKNYILAVSSAYHGNNCAMVIKR